MTVVHQLLAAASPRDAVTGQAFAWRSALRSWGFGGDIVAEHVHPELAGAVRRLADADRLLADERVILHYSIWSAVVPAALAAGGPLGVCYHNVTPGSLLRQHNPALADDCDRARGALTGLRGRVAALIADSAFNAAELREAGLGEAAVVPLLLDVDTPPDRDEDVTDSPLVLTVGRIAPNKRIEDVVKAFALLQRHHAPGATLAVVGSDSGFERYRATLERLVGRLGARGVQFTGPVSDAERDDLYARAGAYLCMSEHEGFCAPLVEAMAAGVPVVARRAGAVPETLGGAGLVIEPDLLLAAEALREVTSSVTTRRLLRAAAGRRLTELRPEAVRERLRAALDPLLAT